MPYSINRIQVSKGDKVVSLDWTYDNGRGRRNNSWNLWKPYGNLPLKDCTEGVLLTWLQEQFPEGTTADLDRCIDEDNARKQARAAESDYTPHPSGPPTPVPMPVPDVPDLPVTADVKVKSKKK